MMIKEPGKQFYRSEARYGFTISEVMKRSWAADLKILDEILDICKKIDVKIFACYGTLLGAVRDHGFIPWDDDIDLGLVGDDYVRFTNVIANDYGDRFKIFNSYTRTWYKMNFSHMVNSGEVSFDREYLDNWCGCPFMTGLDIYPYYYIPRNKDEEEYILDLLGKIDNAIALSRLTETAIGSNMDSEKRIREMLAFELVELQHLTGCRFSNDRPLDNQLEILYDQVCRITDEDSSDYVARYDEYTKDKNNKYPKEYLRNIVYFPFEYTKMPCPIGYNDVLVKRFGEGYIVPRQEKGAHDYPYYKKQLDDKDYYEEEVKRGLRVSTTSKKNAKDISDPVFKSHIRRRLYHTSVYEMLIHGDNAIDVITNTFENLIHMEDGVELWWMPDLFLKTDDWAMDMVAPDLIEEYESLLHKYVDLGINIINVTDEYEEITRCFDEYYGDAGILAQRFLRAHKKVMLQDYKDYSINTEDASGEKKDKIKDIPNTWKRFILRKDGSVKKVIIYITGQSVLFQYREKIIDKIRNVLGTFCSNSEDIALVWRPYIMNETDEAIFGKSFVDKMNNLLEEYRSGDWGILDTSCDPEMAINIADAVYGDREFIVSKCIEKRMPIMIQNPDIM